MDAFVMTSTEEKATRAIQRTIKQSKKVMRPRLKVNKKGRRIKRNGPIRPFKELRALLESSIITEKDILDADTLNARTRSQRAQWQQNTFSSGGTSADSTHSSGASSPNIQQRNNMTDLSHVSISSFPFHTKSSLTEDNLAIPNRKPSAARECSPLSPNLGDDATSTKSLNTGARSCCRDYKSDSTASKITETFQGHLRRSQRIAGVDRDYTFLKYKHSSNVTTFTSTEVCLNDFAKLSATPPAISSNYSSLNVDNPVTLDHAYSKPPTPSNQGKPFNISPIHLGFSRDSKSKHYRNLSNSTRMRNWRKMLNLVSEDDDEDEDDDDSDEDDTDDDEDETDECQENKKKGRLKNYKCKRKSGVYVAGNKKNTTAKVDFNVKMDTGKNNSAKSSENEKFSLCERRREELSESSNDLVNLSSIAGSSDGSLREELSDSIITTGKRNTSPNYKRWKKKPVNVQKGSHQTSSLVVRQRMRRGRGGGGPKQVGRPLARTCSMQNVNGLPTLQNFDGAPLESHLSSMYNNILFSRETALHTNHGECLEGSPNFTGNCNDLMTMHTVTPNNRMNQFSFFNHGLPYTETITTKARHVSFENQYRNGEKENQLQFCDENGVMHHQPSEFLRNRNDIFSGYDLPSTPSNSSNKYDINTRTDNDAEGNRSDTAFSLNTINNFSHNKRRGRPLKYLSAGKEQKGNPTEPRAPTSERRDKGTHSLTGHRLKRGLPPRPLTKWSLLTREQKTSIKGWTYLIQLALSPSQVKEFWEAVEKDVVKMQMEYLRHKGQQSDWEMDEDLMTELRNGLIWKHVCRCHDVITKQLRGKLRDLTREILEEQSACDRYLLAKQVDIAKNICALTEWCSTTPTPLDSQTEVNTTSSRLTEILQTLQELEDRQQDAGSGPAEMELLSLGGESFVVPVAVNTEICDSLLHEEQFTEVSSEDVEKFFKSGSDVSLRSNPEQCGCNRQPLNRVSEEDVSELKHDWMAEERT